MDDSNQYGVYFWRLDECWRLFERFFGSFLVDIVNEDNELVRLFQAITPTESRWLIDRIYQ